MFRFFFTRVIPGILLLAFILFLVLSGSFPGCDRQQGPPPPPKKRAYYPKTDLQLQQGSLMEALNTESRWVDSVFETLSPDERIAQLMIVEGYSNMGRKYEKDLLMLVEKYKVGGIIYFQGGPVRQARLTNRLQAVSRVPLLLSMDAESGVGMRLDSTVQYPLPMLIGAARTDTFAYMLGAEIAREFKRLGMHVNFGPVADINNNPANPVISYRAFGENKEIVRTKSVAYTLGMQDNGVIAVGKHFPGHGDTDVDSHFDLPIVPFTRKRLDSLELDPFRALIKAGVGGIMVAHMHIPMLDDAPNVPASLSHAITTKLLQHDMGYKGLVFTDAMVMKGVTKYFPPGVAELKALEAGNDIIERIASVPIALKVIREAIKRGEISQTEIDRRCKKVLRAKLWVGLNKLKPIETKHLIGDLHPPGSDTLNRLLAEASVTMLRNQNGILPLQWSALKQSKKKVATLSFGAGKPTVFQNIAKEQIQAPAFTANRRGKAADIARLKKAMQKYDIVILGIHGPSIRPSNNLGYGPAETNFINELIRSGKAIVCFFDNAYALSQFEEMPNARALLVGYQQLSAVQEATAKVVFGQLKPRGKLPVTVNRHFPYGAGITAYFIPAAASSQTETTPKNGTKATPRTVKESAVKSKKKRN